MMKNNNNNKNLYFMGFAALFAILALGLAFSLFSSENKLSDENMAGQAIRVSQSMQEPVTTTNDLLDMCINSALLQSTFHCQRIGQPNEDCFSEYFGIVFRSCSEMISN